MTTEPVILRRGKLDSRDAAIVAAVARAWNEAGHPVAMHELITRLPGLSVSGFRYRVKGYCNNRSRRVGPSLVESGWVAVEAMLAGSLRPGPRFAGLDAGWPLELATA